MIINSITAVVDQQPTTSTSWKNSQMVKQIYCKLETLTDTNQNHEIDKYKAQSGVIINMNTAVADQHLVRFTDPLAAGSGSEFQYQPTSISGLANLTDQHRTTGWKNSASQDYDDEH